MKLTSIEIFEKLSSEEQQNEIIKAIEDKFINKDFTNYSKNTIYFKIQNNNYSDFDLQHVVDMYKKNVGWKYIKYKKFYWIDNGIIDIVRFTFNK